MKAWNYDPLFPCWPWHGITQLLFGCTSYVWIFPKSIYWHKCWCTAICIISKVLWRPFWHKVHVTLNQKDFAMLYKRWQCSHCLTCLSNKRTFLSSLMSLCFPWSPLVPLRIRKGLCLLAYDRVNKRNATLHTSKDKCGHIKTYHSTHTDHLGHFFSFLPIRHCERSCCQILTLFVLRIGFKGQSAIGGESEEQICQMDNPWGYVFTICERSVSLTLNPSFCFPLYVASLTQHTLFQYYSFILLDLFPSALSLAPFASTSRCDTMKEMKRMRETSSSLLL